MYKKELSDFVDWKINLKLFCLQDQGGNEIYVQPRLLKLLAVLLDNANRVVRKEELIELAWNDVVVGEESLSKAAFDLRKFLKDNFQNAPEIITIRKVGYRLQLAEDNVVSSRKNKTVKVLKTAFYVLGIATLVVLVLRGLSY